MVGVKVSDTTAETTMAMLSVTENSRKSRPTMPPMSKSGMKTASSDTVIDTMVKPISRAPRNAASLGAMPCSTWRMMFSTTTMASSTTNPVAMVRAMRDKLSML